MRDLGLMESKLFLVSIVRLEVVNVLGGIALFVAPIDRKVLDDDVVGSKLHRAVVGVMRGNVDGADFGQSTRETSGNQDLVRERVQTSRANASNEFQPLHYWLSL